MDLRGHILFKLTIARRGRLTRRCAYTEVLEMAWLDSRRNQLLLGGSVGALFGGLFAHLVGVEPALVPVLAGFALGQVVAVVAASRRQAN